MGTDIERDTELFVWTDTPEQAARFFGLAPEKTRIRRVLDWGQPAEDADGRLLFAVMAPAEGGSR